MSKYSALSLQELVNRATAILDEHFSEPRWGGMALVISIRRQLEYISERVRQNSIFSEEEQGRFVLGIQSVREPLHDELSEINMVIAWRVQDLIDWRTHEPAARAARAAWVDVVRNMPELQSLPHDSEVRKLPTDDLLRRAGAITDIILRQDGVPPLYRTIREQLDYIAKVPRRRWFRKKVTREEVAARPNLARIARNDFSDILPGYALLLDDIHMRWAYEKL